MIKTNPRIEFTNPDFVTDIEVTEISWPPSEEAGLSGGYELEHPYSVKIHMEVGELLDYNAIPFELCRVYGTNEMISYRLYKIFNPHPFSDASKLRLVYNAHVLS